VEASHAVIRTQLSWKPQIPPGAFASFFFKKRASLSFGKRFQGVGVADDKIQSRFFSKKN